MRKFFQNLRLQNRLLFGFFTIALILFGYGITQYTLWNSNDKTQSQINTLSEIESQLKNLKYQIRTEMHFNTQMLRSESQEELKKWWEKHSAEEEVIRAELNNIIKKTSTRIDTVYLDDFIEINQTLDKIKTTYNEIYIPSFQRVRNLKEEIITPVNVGEEIALQIVPPMAVNLNEQQDTSLAAKASLDSLINLQYEKIDAYNDKIRTTKSQLELLNEALNKTTNQIFTQIDQIESLNSDILKNIKSARQNQSALSKRITIIIVLIGFAFALVISLLTARSVTKPLNLLFSHLQMLSKGEFPENTIVERKDEIGIMSSALNQLVDGLRQTSNFALEIGKGNFKSEFEPMSRKDVLGNSLIDMRKSLQQAQKEEEKRKIEDERRNWATNGLAKFGEILGHHTEDIKLLSKDVIINLVEYLNINQGGIFILQEDEDKNTYLELTAAYAYNREKHLKKKVLMGEGLLGAAALERHTVYMTDIPEEYIEIESGTGSAQPKAVLIVPLTMEDTTLGVIELASFNELNQHEIELVERIAENVASTLATTKINSQTNLLLKQSKAQAIEMQVQEEKMLQTIEELRSSQEEILEREEKLKQHLQELEDTKQRLIKKEEEQQARIAELNKDNRNKIKQLKESELTSTTVLEASTDPIIMSNKRGSIEFFNPAAEKLWGYKASEVLGKNVTELMTVNHSIKHDAYMDNYLHTGIRKIIGIGREVPIETKAGEEIPVYLTVTEIKAGNDVKFVAFMRDLSETKRINKERNEAMQNILVKEFELTAEIDVLQKILRDNSIPAPNMADLEVKLIDWDSSYNIGLTVIDQQHKNWVQKINALYKAFKDNKKTEEIVHLFDDVIEYTDYHFSFEERYMLEFKCNEIELHKYEHDQFLNKIRNYKEDYINHLPNTSYSLLLYMKKWLKNHFVTHDEKFVECFRKNGIS